MKTLKFVEGNLLTNDIVEVIGHQANCQNTFGSGIARSIREMYPEAYAADTEAAKNKTNTLGNFSYTDISTGAVFPRNKYGNKIYRIYNLYGQNLGTIHGKRMRMTNYEALYSALEGMADQLRATEEDNGMFDFNREPVVGFPFMMGSALGGGRWEIVQRLIEVAFDGYTGDVLIVKLNG